MSDSDGLDRTDHSATAGMAQGYRQGVNMASEMQGENNDTQTQDLPNEVPPLLNPRMSPDTGQPHPFDIFPPKNRSKRKQSFLLDRCRWDRS